MCGEQFQQRDFPQRKPGRFVSPDGAEPASLDLPAAEREPVRRGRREGGFLLLALPAAQLRGDAGGELAQPERLGHIVVRPEFEPEHLVELLPLRGQHDDGNQRVVLPDPAAHIVAGEPRHHDVEQQQIRMVFVVEPERCAAVRRFDGDVSFEFERVGDSGADVAVVFGNQDLIRFHVPVPPVIE